MSTVKDPSGALGGPFFDHFFGSIVGSIVDSFWDRFGLLLGAFLEPKSGQVELKMCLEAIFVVVRCFSRPHRYRPFWGTKIRPKIEPGSPQDCSKRDKQVMHFSC